MWFTLVAGLGSLGFPLPEVLGSLAAGPSVPLALPLVLLAGVFLVGRMVGPKPLASIAQVGIARALVGTYHAGRKLGYI